MIPDICGDISSQLMNQRENQFEEQREYWTQEKWKTDDQHPGGFSSKSNLFFPDDTEILRSKQN